MGREFEIRQAPAKLGGGWDLRLIEEDSQERGRFLLPVVFDNAAGMAWWDSIAEADRTTWLRRAGDNSTWVDAYREHLSNEAHEDAVMLGNEWLDSFRGLRR